MNREEKILFLDSFRMKIELLNNLWDKYNTLVSSMQNCKPVDLSGMPRGGNTADISDKIGKKIEIEQRIDRLTDKISDMKNAIIEEIDNYIYEPRINDSMFMFYIEGCDKSDIAEVVERSVRQVDRYLEIGLELVFNN